MATDIKPKAVQAFFTRANEKGPAVSLFVNEQVAGKRIPEFGGQVDGKQVAMRIRNSAKGNFMAVMESRKSTTEKDEKGRFKLEEHQIGTARIFVNDKGQPRLVVNLDPKKEGDPKPEPIYASLRKGNDELMARAGLNAEKMTTVRAERAAAAANDPAPAKKSAPKAA